MLTAQQMQPVDPLGDGISRLALIDAMGGDLAVVNDARASFDRVSSELTEADVKLIRYLINNEHTSPLRGTVLKFRVKAPLFVARQWYKHAVASSHVEEQLGWNEMSLRYVDVSDRAEFYVPPRYRGQSAQNRQASAGFIDQPSAETYYRSALGVSLGAYMDLLALGVAREQARAVLPSALYVTWVWTASLQSVLHFCDLRIGPGAQQEIGAYARHVLKMATAVAPVTAGVWTAYLGIEEP